MKVKQILREHGFRPKKRLGQNFLINEAAAQRIVDFARISRDDVVVEIGPGLGILTRPLLERAREVIAVEIDERLCDILGKNFPGYGNLKVVCEDILKVGIQSLVKDGKVKIVGNLPYYITSPLIFHLLEQRRAIDSILITLQKEVAERILASPGTKDCGAISVGVRFYTRPSHVGTISRAQFWPRPKVDAGVIKLEVLDSPSVPVGDEELFFKVVRASFGKRRKMILNSLSKAKTLGLKKDLLMKAFLDAEIDFRKRPEELSIEKFARISDLVGGLIGEKKKVVSF